MADLERGHGPAELARIAALWREAADALEPPAPAAISDPVGNAIRSLRGYGCFQTANELEVECGRLREQLDAARKALQHYADQDTWDLDSFSNDASNTAGYVFWHYDGRVAEPWSVARAALGVVGEEKRDGKAAT